MTVLDSTRCRAPGRSTSTPADVPAQNSRTTLPEPSIRPALWVAGAAVIALLLKLAIAFNTMGTNDVVRFYQFARVLSEQGLEETYRHLDAFNHPPLVACFLTAIYRLARIPLFETTGLSFAFLLRLPGIIADFIVVFLFLWLRKQGPQLKLPLWALLLFALSPVSIMVSGFHGNTDPVMVLFLVLATIAALRQRPIWCGILLALSCQIKIIPVLLIPAFFFFWNERRRLLCFLPPLVLTTAILWSQPLLQFPLVFFRNVFGYGSFWGIWGITYCLQKTGWSEFSQVDFQNLSPAQNVIGCLLKVLIVAAIVVLTWRRRQIVSARGFLTTLAFTWLIFFVLSPGIGAQYLVWLAPFILLVSPTFYAACVVGSSLFLFFFYNTISGGFPWYYGLSNGTRDAEWLPWSLWPWIILCVGMVLLWRKTAAEEARAQGAEALR